MSVMSVLDLQCQEAQVLFANFFEQADEVPPLAVALAVLEQLTYHCTPVGAWELTIPYMIEWAWAEFALQSPSVLH